MTITIGGTNITFNDATTMASAAKEMVLSSTQSFSAASSSEFTDIESTVKRIIVMVRGTTSSDNLTPPIIQLGTSGSYVTTGYTGSAFASDSGTTHLTALTSGFSLTSASDHVNTWNFTGTLVLMRNSNYWMAKGNFNSYTLGYSHQVAGGVSLASALTRLRITADAGTVTGNIAILKEF